MWSHRSLRVTANGIIAIAILTSAVGAQAPTVTLGEARRLSAAVDPATVAARSQSSTAAWERRAAMANLFTPIVTAGANVTSFSDPFFNLGTGDISSKSTSATVQAHYTLLGAGKLGDLRSARASVDRAEANEVAAKYRSALETDAAYFAVLANQELSRVSNGRLLRAEEAFGIARLRVQEGEAIPSDSLQLLLEVNRARLELLSRDSALITSRLALGARIGLQGSADAAPIDSAPPPALPISQDEAVEELRRRGPELEAARATERFANAVVTSRSERYLPEIALDATVGAYDAELFPSATRRSQVALSVSLPIWNGGQRELAVARARADRANASAVRQEGERAAGEVMSEAYQGYVTARAAIDLARVGVAAAAENYRVQRVRYAEGATTILDLLEAQVGLSEAQAALVQSRYAAQLSLARIEALLGRRVFE
jgi:cobalt-zinc-cadmium efflux system outer membrane protein